MTLLAAFLVALLVPRTPSATVTFKGFKSGGEGTRQAIFTIANNGRGTLRRWDFYDATIQGKRKVIEHHLGPDAILAPGQSEQVIIEAPSNESAWKVTFHFTDYNPIEGSAYHNSGPGKLPNFISDKLIDGKIDLKIATDWIHPIQ